MWPFLDLAYLRLRRAYRRALWYAKTEAKELRAVEEHEAAYSEAVKEAEKRGASHGELAELDAEHWEAGRELMDELAATQTDRLRSGARRFGVPVPPLSDKTAWEEIGKRRTLRPVLSDRAMADLREKVAAARREWLESTGKFLSGLVPLAALLVALVTAIGTCWIRTGR